MREIIIEIDESGNYTIEGIGFVGQDCKKLTKGIEEEMGKVEKTTLKPEYHRTETVKQKVVR